MSTLISASTESLKVSLTVIILSSSKSWEIPGPSVESGFGVVGFFLWQSNHNARFKTSARFTVQRTSKLPRWPFWRSIPPEFPWEDGQTLTLKLRLSTPVDPSRAQPRPVFKTSIMCTDFASVMAAKYNISSKTRPGIQVLVDAEQRGTLCGST